jgi:hypothetical protein
MSEHFFGQDPYRLDWRDLRHDYRMQFAFGLSSRQQRAFTIVTPLETATPAELLAELREKDPGSAMMLGEYLVPDEHGKVPPEQIDGLIDVLGLGDS